MTTFIKTTKVSVYKNNPPLPEEVPLFTYTVLIEEIQNDVVITKVNVDYKIKNHD